MVVACIEANQIASIHDISVFKLHLVLFPFPFRGADEDMNGATAQADILGIFGREGLDLAARWDLVRDTPTYQVSLGYLKLSIVLS